MILQTLDEVGWVIGGPKGAAVKLGVRRTTLTHKMKRLEIRFLVCPYLRCREGVGCSKSRFERTAHCVFELCSCPRQLSHYGSAWYSQYASRFADRETVHIAQLKCSS